MGKKENRRGREDRNLDEEAQSAAAVAVDTDNGEAEPASRIPVGDLGEGVPALEEEDSSTLEFSSIETEKGDVFKIIVDLEAQLESTFAMKEALENDLEASRKEAGDLRWNRKELEARLKVLEQEAAAAADLQSELAFVEDEKSRALEKSQDLEAKLGSVTEELGATKAASAELQGNLRDAEKARGDLESQVYRLNEKVRALEEVQADLVEVRSERDKAVDRCRDLESEVASMKTANNALEVALKHAEQAVKELRDDKKRLEKSVVDLQDEKRAGKAQAARLAEENEAAQARIAVLDNEVTAVTARNHTLDAELETARKTLGEIHTALADTKAKARKRYYRIKKK